MCEALALLLSPHEKARESELAPSTLTSTQEASGLAVIRSGQQRFEMTFTKF